jgi:hypothetical protein
MADFFYGDNRIRVFTKDSGVFLRNESNAEYGIITSAESGLEKIVGQGSSMIHSPKAQTILIVWRGQPEHRLIAGTNETNPFRRDLVSFMDKLMDPDD